MGRVDMEGMEGMEETVDRGDRGDRGGMAGANPNARAHSSRSEARIRTYLRANVAGDQFPLATH
jgi:hypothetical protein